MNPQPSRTVRVTNAGVGSARGMSKSSVVDKLKLDIDLDSSRGVITVSGTDITFDKEPKL